MILNILALGLLIYVLGAIVANLALDYLMGIKDPAYKQLLVVIWPLLFVTLLLYVLLLIAITIIAVIANLIGYILSKVLKV